MGRSLNSETEPARTLRAVGLRLPDTQAGIACAGTALERRTITVGDKAFLFVGDRDARLKLGDSIGEATELAAREPGLCEVGGHGWVKLTFGDGRSLPVDVLTRWVEESYQLLAPARRATPRPTRKPAASPGKPANARAAKKPAPRKRSS